MEEGEWKGELHPLILIGIFIVVFLAIHPFQDGNGRLSRILTALLLLRHGYSYIPYVSMEAIIEQNKENYYKSLRRTQKTINTDRQNWIFWLVFFLRTLQKQKNRLLEKIETSDTSISDLTEQILQVIKEHGRASVKDIEQITGANRNTIKSHIKKLVEQRHITMHGKGRGVWYSLG